MDARAIGLILVWLGAIALVAVLQHRMRRGAFGEQAFDSPHPVGLRSKAISIAGMALAVLGAALTVASFW